MSSVTAAVIRRFVPDDMTLRGIFAACFFGSLVPMTEFSLTHYVRVVTGDLSVTSIVWFAWLGISAQRGTPTREQQSMAVIVVLTALIVYPTALGLTPFDVYAHGYYPVILAPVVFVLFAFSAWRGAIQPAVSLSLAFICYALSFLDSDNLFDYLVDPAISFYAIYLVIRNRDQARSWLPGVIDLKLLAGISVVTAMTFAIFLQLR